MRLSFSFTGVPVLGGEAAVVDREAPGRDRSGQDKLKDAWDHVVVRHGDKADDGVASGQWTHANSFTILGFI